MRAAFRLHDVGGADDQAVRTGSNAADAPQEFSIVPGIPARSLALEDLVGAVGEHDEIGATTRKLSLPTFGLPRQGCACPGTVDAKRIQHHAWLGTLDSRPEKLGH